MRQDLQLYVNGYELDLSEDFEVNMTYTIEQTTNPTAIKNNYSKTITIPATGNNNKIFGNIWNMTSVYNNDFDLTKKADFQLFVNGDKFEEGYIRIDNIIRNGNGVEYKCTLYGGLGDFFYSLSTNENGEKMRLSDLDYGGGKYEFDLMVNKEEVYNAWDGLINGETEGTLYDDINFALCYNGIPDNFNADKVLINVKESGPFNLPYSFDKDDTYYRTKNGWVLSELRQEYDEWASRDLRSYLQRPVFRIKTLFRGLCDPKNNGGYEVRLDKTFFNSNNPYYEKAWITLPLISEMDEVVFGNTTQDGLFVDIVGGEVYFDSSNLEFQYLAPQISVQGDGKNINLIIPFQLITHAELNTLLLKTGLKHLLSGEIVYYNAPIAVQLVGRKKGSTSVEYDYVSNIEVFTSYNDLGNHNYEMESIGGTKNVNEGNFIKSGDTTTYVWGKQLDGGVIRYYVNNLVINNIDDINVYDWEILMTRYEYKSSAYERWNGDRRFLDCVFIDGSENGNNDYSGDYEGNIIPYKAYSTTFMLEDSMAQDYNETDINKRKLTKERMLGKDKTPLDYLLGYTKQFGLYFLKDPKGKTIDIMTRNTFYGKRNIIDLVSNIDISKEITITPLTFDRKWYDMGLEIEENKYSKKYEKYSIIPYGTKRIDTGYEYVKDKQSLLQNSPYKAGMMVREKGAYYVNYRLPKK